MDCWATLALNVMYQNSLFFTALQVLSKPHYFAATVCIRLKLFCTQLTTMDDLVLRMFLPFPIRTKSLGAGLDLSADGGN